MDPNRSFRYLFMVVSWQYLLFHTLHPVPWMSRTHPSTAKLTVKYRIFIMWKTFYSKEWNQHDKLEYMYRLLNWQLLHLLLSRLRLSKRRKAIKLENIFMMELFRFSLEKLLSSDGIFVYLLIALRCVISCLVTPNLLDFCCI